MNNQYNNPDDMRIDLNRVSDGATASRRNNNGNAPTYSTAELNNYKNAELTGGEKVTTFLGRSIAVTFKYFFAKLLASTLIVLGCFFVLRYLGVPSPLVWSLAAGIGNLIPVFGQWIGMGIAVAGVWFTTHDWHNLLYLGIALLVLQILDEFIFTPVIVGKATSFKPILIIAIMFLASTLFGFWGILFAVPAAAVVKLFYEIFFQKKKRE